MGESDKDRLADALSGMSRGESTPDDFVSAPPPDESVFAPRRKTAELLSERRLHGKRTAIPILLTCGILLPAAASLKWLAGEDSPFAAWPWWAAAMLIALGLLILGLAVTNMLQVRDELSRRV